MPQNNPDPKVLARAGRLAEKVGTEAVHELLNAHDEHFDGIKAIIGDGGAFDNIIVWGVSVVQVIRALLEMMLSEDPLEQAVASFCIAEGISPLLQALTEMTYYQGYQQGKIMSQLGTWTVAPSEGTVD